MDLLLLIVVSAVIIAIAVYSVKQILENKEPKEIIKSGIEYLPYKMTDFDLGLIRLINSYRASNGLSLLLIDQELSNVAHSHSEYMANERRMSHDWAEERLAYLKPKLAGEIVAYNFITGLAFLKGWQSSKRHNENYSTQI